MKNELRIIEQNGLNNKDGYTAIFSGKSGSGELINEEESHHIFGETKKDIIQAALFTWGAELDLTEIDFEY